MSWIRVLKVRLRSSLVSKEFTFESTAENVAISVDINQYLSGKQDECKVIMQNLPPDVILAIIQQKYTNISVFAGYKDSFTYQIFKGQIFNLANIQSDRTTTQVTFFAVNNLYGIYNNKLSLSLKSGLNMYGVLDYLAKKMGLRDYVIDEAFRDRILQEDIVSEGTASTLLDEVLDSMGGYASSGNEDSSVVSFWDRRRKVRTWNLTSTNGGIINGRPTLSSRGLSVVSLPIAPYKCGDTIKLDNSLINLPLSSVSEALSSNLGIYLNSDGEYMIQSLSYQLSCDANKQFQVSITAISQSIFENLRS